MRDERLLLKELIDVTSSTIRSLMRVRAALYREREELFNMLGEIPDEIFKQECQKIRDAIAENVKRVHEEKEELYEYRAMLSRHQTQA